MIMEGNEIVIDKTAESEENENLENKKFSFEPQLIDKVETCNEDLENKDFSVELEGFPYILKYIKKLQEQIKVQKNTIVKLTVVLENKEIQCDLSDKSLVDNHTQTDLPRDKSPQDWVISNSKEAGTLADQVKEAAESAILQTGFVYEKTTGLYYHYESGYYYDPKSGLYYDGNSGTYYYYDEGSKSYKFHSQISRESAEPMDISPSIIKEKNNRQKNKDRTKKIKLSKEAKEKDVIEVEEGECSDSDNESSSSSVEVITIGSPENNNEDIAKDYPPCMRIIVKETQISKLKIGTLFLVTCIGGSIGREGDHPVLLRDINISKYHAKLQYNAEKRLYEIIDLGSRNGTLVNGKRISAAKQESEAMEIVHGAIIQLGSTKLLCHIHKGSETCGHCEPGLLQTTISAEPTYRSTKAEHESERKRIKQKYGLEEDNIDEASRVAMGYQDRAQSRRNNVGSTCQFAKTQQSSLNESISKDNPGFKMLAKMGWTEGTSLGKSGTGLTEPVPLLQKVDKAGLGASQSACPAADDESDLHLVEKKQVIWKKTQQRYDEIAK
ncbi:angiogenic factor with G patch and FHA domains 1-like [Phymastichus coffea]|uniref:angiogenic factor with G patch and FHA domains 1-like n=1 Tax=Phymastichus coffea TaxID=108790 RepID=UPI00273B1231|nr:angiogenic factor with G patch and FHA domains 1-like [Phymastichus coffea]